MNTGSAVSFLINNEVDLFTEHLSLESVVFQELSLKDSSVPRKLGSYPIALSCQLLFAEIFPIFELLQFYMMVNDLLV
jgi:hypothetical protein